ncbi:helix-turn-helix domain-containing protein [Actinomadura rayongensis]|uniref:ParB N-terminal domain-containing protein n=1 Tax=Actinomadura rayongensis TaxID=1429076 RepID=A0A6I4W196_9ACTN|nr:helix-turn-helix domain-containing protein [Actinomadura rayongensis]MXQ63058.1 ParB N-terminal domain-containing protein [Actinomadura rayongensis]
MTADLTAEPYEEPAAPALPQDPPVLLPVASLTTGDSPRRTPVDPEHVRRLAASGAPFPPVLAHARTLRVIDGLHRLAAARLRGDERIAVRLFTGAERDAFVLAVRANAVHGLPLTAADRRAAALRIFASHPAASDRMVAGIVGMSARTVARLRAAREVTAAARVGRDGRVRPASGAAGRRRAAALAAAHPDWSLRRIAREAGISPETVRDVRRRTSRGEDPVPERRARPVPDGPDDDGTADRLRGDLLQSEAGRALLRLLNSHAVDAGEWERMKQTLPPHCGDIVADLALECGRVWNAFAERVERRIGDVA